MHWWDFWFRKDFGLAQSLRTTTTREPPAEIEAVIMSLDSVSTFCIIRVSAKHETIRVSLDSLASQSVLHDVVATTSRLMFRRRCCCKPHPTYCNPPTSLQNRSLEASLITKLKRKERGALHSYGQSMPPDKSRNNVKTDGILIRLRLVLFVPWKRSLVTILCTTLYTIRVLFYLERRYRFEALCGELCWWRFS